MAKRTWLVRLRKQVAEKLGEPSPICVYLESVFERIVGVFGPARA
jgi:hypothetical protein